MESTFYPSNAEIMLRQRPLQVGAMVDSKPDNTHLHRRRLESNNWEDQKDQSNLSSPRNLDSSSQQISQLMAQAQQALNSNPSLPQDSLVL